MYGGIAAEKQRIRAEVKRITAGLAPAYREEASRAITAQVLVLPEWRRAGTVMAFVSLEGEPDTREILRQALAQGKTLLLPRCADRTRMEALPVTDLAGLVPGRLGIPEPPALETGALPPEPDLILVPCVCASPGGIRLGHGAGYYDRFLAEHEGTAVCLCFRRLLRADLPAEGTDVPVSRVITD